MTDETIELPISIVKRMLKILESLQDAHRTNQSAVYARRLLGESSDAQGDQQEIGALATRLRGKTRG